MMWWVFWILIIISCQHYRIHFCSRFYYYHINSRVKSYMIGYYRRGFFNEIFKRAAISWLLLILVNPTKSLLAWFDITYHQLNEIHWCWKCYNESLDFWWKAPPSSLSGWCHFCQEKEELRVKATAIVH